jgi:RNA polymerase sigma-19 factor, ECF subfamily
MHISKSGKGVSQWHVDESVAFATTFNQFYSSLVFFARKLIRDEFAAEDIVTEIFLKYWKKQKHFNSLPAVKSYLYISTRNACLNHLHHRRYEAATKADLLVLSDDFDDHVLNQITRTEVLRQVYSIVESLPVECRKIVLMSFIGGMSNQQIARRLHISVHTVKNQKFRGIRLMRTRAQKCY